MILKKKRHKLETQIAVPNQRSPIYVVDRGRLRTDVLQYKLYVEENWSVPIQVRSRGKLEVSQKAVYSQELKLVRCREVPWSSPREPQSIANSRTVSVLCAQKHAIVCHSEQRLGEAEASMNTCNKIRRWDRVMDAVLRTSRNIYAWRRQTTTEYFVVKEGIRWIVLLLYDC